MAGWWPEVIPAQAAVNDPEALERPVVALPQAVIGAALPDGPVLRPNGERYLPRELGGIPDVLVLRRLAETGLYVLLVGEPGVGKTALVEAAFPEALTVPCSGDLTVAHLVGTHLPTDDGRWRWRDGPLVTAMREGHPLYLDEVALLPPEVSTVLHSVMDGRGWLRIDDRPDSPPVRPADGFFVVGSYNPGSLSGRRPPEALLSRFAVTVEVRSDFDAARALGVMEELVTIAENLRVRSDSDRTEGGPGTWGPQLRELLSAQRLIDCGLGGELAVRALVAMCPSPEDAADVTEVVEHVLGRRVLPLRLGLQV